MYWLWTCMFIAIEVGGVSPSCDETHIGKQNKRDGYFSVYEQE